VTHPVTVGGGTNSIAAQFDQILVLAAALSSVAAALGPIHATAIRTATDPALVPAALLDPFGAASVANACAAVLACVVATELECIALADGLRKAAASYLMADKLDCRLAPVTAALRYLPGAVGRYLRNPGNAGLKSAVASDPYLGTIAIDMLSLGIDAVLDPSLLISDALGSDREASGAAFLSALLASQFSDGKAVLRRKFGEPTDDATGSPRGVNDLIRGLQVRSEGNQGGAVDVRIIAGASRPDGTVSRAAIVDITGTTDWSLNRRNPAVSDTGSNLRTLANQSGAYEQGVIAALRASGISPDEPILLVGHSQGGMVAVRAAIDLTRTREFHVTHVITAGSPLGLVNVPSGIEVLAIENGKDVVPTLDGLSNARLPNLTTVTIDRGGARLGDRHSLDAYLQGAADIDASSDPSIRAFLRGAEQFLEGTIITTHVFQVGRLP
jgi:pimeloyl-ACP methyl ester carboxylesterase